MVRTPRLAPLGGAGAPSPHGTHPRAWLWSTVQPFTVLAADGITPLDAAAYTVQSTDITVDNPGNVRVTLQADNRSLQLDAIGAPDSGANVRLTTRVGGVTKNGSELVTVTAPVDRSGPVFGAAGAPFRTP